MSASSHLLSELHGTSSLVVGSICVALALIGAVLKRRTERPQEEPLLVPRPPPQQLMYQLCVNTAK